MTKLQKNLLVVCLAMGEVTVGCLYLNMISFFPLFATEKYGKDHISATMISFAIIALELSGLLTTPLYNYLAAKFGRKTALMNGWLLLMITTSSLGVLGNLPADEWLLFYSLTVVSRLLQGFADSLVMTT